MTDLRKAAEMALHALKFSQNMKRCFARAEQDYHEKIAPIAIETLRQALAQPEQKPVAHLWECLGRWSAYLATNGTQADCAPPDYLVKAVEAVTASPSKPFVFLTKEDMPSGDHPMYDTKEFYAGMAWAQTKLKEKNT